ncbi:MAG: hypothetical protein K0Q59_5081 [Paenibacillus sp.]|jgi:uncharacterized repeat protein (TIGR03943 family)|nr:hypothetical protein [Paenibacillus sp.]
MEEKRSLTAHYVFRTVILAGFAFYVLYLVKSGRLTYYIAPRMDVYVKGAAVALFVFALYQAFLGLRSFFGKEEASCDCGHVPPRSAFGSIWLYGLFLLPLTLGFLLPDKLMGSDIVSIKGMNLSSGTVKAESRAVTASSPPEAAKKPVGEEGTSADGDKTVDANALFAEDESKNAFAALGKKLYAKDRITIKDEGFMELLTTVDLFLDGYVGKQMELTGFVHREPDMKGSQFVVARLAMMCCSADTSPYGVLVQSAMGNGLDKDAWVKVTGTIGTTNYRGNKIMVLDATSIRKVDAPESPYVYPYFDEFVKLAD